MSRRSKIMLWTGVGFAGLLLFLLVSIILIAPSAWFRDQVREGIVREVENATGGRVTIASFNFDWRALRAVVTDFVVHGTEPPSAPALFRAHSVTVGLKIISVLKKQVDIQSLDVNQPQVHLMVYPDGRTNVPEPKIKRISDRTAMETILDLAVGRLTVQNGFAEIAEQKTPFNARGENLRAQFVYEFLGPRYRGEISIQQLQFKLARHAPVPFAVKVSATMEKNRIEISRAKLSTGKSEMEFSGALDDLANTRGWFQYSARVVLDELGRVLELRSNQEGTVEIGGNIRLSGPSDYQATGNLHAARVGFRHGALRIQNGSFDSAIVANTDKAELCHTRISAVVVNLPLEGHVDKISLLIKPEDVAVDGIRISAVGGTLTARGELKAFDRYRMEGSIQNLDIQLIMALLSNVPAPWDGLVSGPIKVQGSLKAVNDLKASASLAISPAPRGTPVKGHFDANYDGRRGFLDLGQSFITLPSTQLAVTGAIGRELRVKLASTNLNDFAPLVKTPPVELHNGSAMFDGSVTGQLDSPRISGHLAVTNFAYSQAQFDSFNADVTLQKNAVEVHNGSLVRGQMRGQFHGSVALRDWKPDQSGSISATTSVQHASLAELAAMAEQSTVPITGTLQLVAQVSGSVGDPHIATEVKVGKGTIYEEPFDRLEAKLNYSNQLIEVSAVKLTAGSKQLDLQGSFEHPTADFQNGRLRFRVASNRMALDQFQTLLKDRPGIKGMVQLDAAGAVTLSKSEFQIADLNADASAQGMELGGKSLGNTHLSAKTQSGSLVANLDSDFANSVIHGQGRWRLEGDYPGTAEVAFSRLDFAAFEAWLAPRKSSGETGISGSADGKLAVTGPALKPDLWQARLEIPNFALSPRNKGRRADLTIRNSGPIQITIEKSVVRVESARFVARSTDLLITGTMSLKPKSALDVRAKGQADLSLLRDFNPDVVSSGLVTADAAIRGALDQPQIAGRLQLKNASFSVADAPEGLSNTNGTIQFDGSRANIQTLAGEMGGGKVVATGFVAFGGGNLAFRLQAKANQVRLRRPEGVSTVANAVLDLTGSSDRSVLAGTVTIVRTGFNPHSDLSSILAKSAQPVETPSAKTGLLSNMQFDIQIETSPDISFQSALAQNLQAEARLQLRGTLSNPALLGRVNITQGELIFFGTKFTINQGSIAFYNPVRVEPILNIDLETKARGIDVTLTVTGPISKLNVTPRSDPPLPLSDILALLATGRAPSSQPTLTGKQTTASQTWQQMGASALVGQAIANPVAGRLQRFFGVTRLKIDPTFLGTGGPETNPQARLTMEQQVSNNLTFTYITDISSGNPQVVRTEWALSKEWSAVLLREENGLIGVDFLYKKRFK